jgi:peptidoglycan hydrolase CwlO-like protein
MKKIVVTLLAAIICVSAMFAQNVTEQSMAMSQGTNNGFSVKLPGTTKKDVEKAWKKYVDEYKGKVKTDKKTDETLSNNSIIKKINGDNTIDIYAKVAEDGKESTTLNVWFNLGGAYLSSQAHGDKAKEAQAMLSAFALSVSRTMVEDQLKEEQKKLKKEEGTLKDLEKDKKGLEKDIEDWKKKIAKAEGEIKTNEEKQKEQTAAIAKQQDVVKEVTKKLDSLK